MPPNQVTATAAAGSTSTSKNSKSRSKSKKQHAAAAERNTKLLPRELWWRDHQPWLEEQGYVLRERFRPGWTPSWVGTGKRYWMADDGIANPSECIMVAIEAKSGKKVVLKKLDQRLHPYEVELTKMWTSSPATSKTASQRQSQGEASSPTSPPFPFPSPPSFPVPNSPTISHTTTSETIVQEDYSPTCTLDVATHPENHCVQLIAALTPPDDAAMAVLVLPRLRSAYDPKFRTFGEAVDFIYQCFRGLRYMHAMNVAHRDSNFRNIMMDASELYPDGWHHSYEYAADSHDAYLKDISPRHYTRTEKPPKCLFIDFGISRRYKEAEMPSPLEDPIRGGDKSAPEFRDLEKLRPCDPFATDVYYVGNMVREVFIEGYAPATEVFPGYHGFDFLSGLIHDMVQDDPAKRPTMHEVVQRFDVITLELSEKKLRTRLVRKDETLLAKPWRIYKHWRKKREYEAKGLPAAAFAKVDRTVRS